MKTKQQDRFELLIIRRIIRTPEFDTRFLLLSDFISKREEYYDEFCDRIYDLTQNSRYLLLDHEGKTRLANKKDADSRLGLCLLKDEDIKGDCEDIITYIDLALDRLEENLNSYDDMDRVAAEA